MDAATTSACDQLRAFGYARLDGGLDAGLVARLRAAIAPAILGAVPDTAGFRDHRLLLEESRIQPLVIRDVIARPAALAVVAELLGPEASCKAIGVDVNLPGSRHQTSHMDCGYLFPEHAIALPPFALVLNIPLVDVGDDNGPLELWPGTHGNQRDVDQDRLIAHAPSVRMAMPAGALLMRDIRTWHRGTPNRSAEPRPQIGIVYARPWYGGATVQARDRQDGASAAPSASALAVGVP